MPWTASAEITQRFIPQADAVVFVLDSTRPIIDGNPDYLAWIAKETELDSGQTRGQATERA